MKLDRFEDECKVVEKDGEAIHQRCGAADYGVHDDVFCLVRLRFVGWRCNEGECTEG